MSKRARMKEQEKRRQERERQRGRKHSSSYLKGPKAPGSNSPIYESRHVEITGSDDGADVVVEPPKPREGVYAGAFGSSSPEPSQYHEPGPARSYAPPSPSLESRIDVSSLPLLPADGGVELLLHDTLRGEFVLIGGGNVDAHLSALFTLSTTVFYHERNARLAGIDRYYLYGGGLHSELSSISGLLQVPAHRVRSRAQFEKYYIDLDDFASWSLPSHFQRAQAYVAQALKEAAEYDAQAKGSSSSPVSPASAYVPLDPDPSGIYCVLHNTDGDLLYVFLDPRTLQNAKSLGYMFAAKQFFKDRINSDEFPPALSGVLPGASLPFKFVDPYTTEGILERSGLDAVREGVARVFGAPQHRILSFPHGEFPDIEFEDLAMERYHPQLRDLVMKYTDLARQTDKTVFD